MFPFAPVVRLVIFVFYRVLLNFVVFKDLSLGFPKGVSKLLSKVLFKGTFKIASKCVFKSVSKVLSKVFTKSMSNIMSNVLLENASRYIQRKSSIALGCVQGIS